MISSTLDHSSSSRASTAGAFMTTQWSLVLNAGSVGTSLSSEAALEKLCRKYWLPIFACIRRSGRRREEAEDLTQDFFASLLRYESFSRVHPGKGRFRSFLRASLKHFLSNDWHRRRARKRGGGRPVISLDADRSLSPDECHDERLPELSQIGDYRMLGRLGQGGMGLVFKARRHGHPDPVAIKTIAAGDLAAPPGRASFTPADAQILNTREVTRLSLGNDSETRDLWAENNIIYVARGEFGVDLIDAADQQNPYQVSTIRPFPGVPNIHIEDVQVVNGIAYLANHVPNGSPTPHVGLFIYDVSVPGAPLELGRLEWGAGPWYHLGANIHNLFIHDTGTSVYAYVASLTTSAVEVFDVTVPSAPIYQSTIYPPLTQYGTIPGQSHEISVQGNLCFTTWLDGGFANHDISNPLAPTAALTVQGFGVMSYRPGSGDYILTTYSRRKPKKVTVDSDLGGSATRSVSRVR